MATVMDEVANIAAMANFSDAEKAAMIQALLANAPATSAAPGAASTSSAPAPAPTLSANNLSVLVARYAAFTTPAEFSDVGNPRGIPSFNPAEPAYVFLNAGPLAIDAIFTGPGLSRAVFNAALGIQEHGRNVVNLIGQPVSDAVQTAVAQYAAGHPSEVPTGSNDVGQQIAVPSMAYPNSPSQVSTYTPPTAAQLAAGAAQDALIAQEDAGKGSVPISSITATDLQYAAYVLGDSFSGFLRSYTSDSNQTINQTINSYLAGGPQAANPNSPPAPSAGTATVVASYKAAVDAARAAQQAARAAK